MRTCQDNDRVAVLAGDGCALRMFFFRCATLGILSSSAVFTEGPSSSLGVIGLRTLSPSGSLRVSILPEFRNVGCVLEIQFNYADSERLFEKPVMLQGPVARPACYPIELQNEVSVQLRFGGRGPRAPRSLRGVFRCALRSAPAARMRGSAPGGPPPRTQP